MNAPILDEYPLWLECKVEKFDEKDGHLQGKIVAMLADDTILTEGKVDLEKFHPIIFDSTGFTYREIGPVVGKAYHDGKAIKKEK